MTPTIELICGHRSIRHFTDEPISDAQREAIINSARATSSSSFLQCSSIIRITDKALREELVTLTGGQKHVAQAAEFWVFCADFNRHLQICPDAQLGLAEQLLLGVVDTAMMAQNALIAAPPRRCMIRGLLTRSDREVQGENCHIVPGWNALFV